MKCKKCGYEWSPHGENMNCPSCQTGNGLTHSERQALWDKVHASEKIKDAKTRALSLLALAEQGDSKAEYEYAECLYRGAGVKQSSDEALLWYKAAASKMHPTAAYRLALCLKDGKAVGVEAQVLFWLRVGAELGDPNAAAELSRMYEEGDGVAPSHRHAILWLMRAARAGHTASAFALVKMYASGEGVEKNPEAARYFASLIPSPNVLQKLYILKLGKGDASEPTDIDLSLSHAESMAVARAAMSAAEYEIAANLYYVLSVKGDAYAGYALALCYEKGNGVPKNEAEARRRYALAAQKGCAEAFVKLGDCAKDGIGGEVDLALALSSYEKGAEAGNADACFAAAEAYKNGTLTEAKLPVALRYYKKAASLGHTGAEEEAEKIEDAVKTVYEKGLASLNASDYPRAYRSLSLASEMGHAGAAYLLGTMFEEGRGVAVDYKKAAEAYRTAASAGNIAAIYRLGILYSEGKGVLCDYAAANKLLAPLAKKNYEKAAAVVEELRRRKHKKAAQKIYSVSSVLYRRGDVTEAIRFRMMAAKLGNARAMFMLGCHFEFGDGLPMDREKAAAWYARAQKAGFRHRAGSDPKGGFLRARKALLLSKKRS